MSAQANYRVLGRVQTNIALESAVLAAAVGRSRAAGSRTGVVGGRAGGLRGGGGGHLGQIRSKTSCKWGDSPGTLIFKLGTYGDLVGGSGSGKQKSRA